MSKVRRSHSQTSNWKEHVTPAQRKDLNLGEGKIILRKKTIELDCLNDQRKAFANREMLLNERSKVFSMRLICEETVNAGNADPSKLLSTCPHPERIVHAYRGIPASLEELNMSNRNLLAVLNALVNQRKQRENDIREMIKKSIRNRKVMTPPKNKPVIDRLMRGLVNRLAKMKSKTIAATNANNSLESIKDQLETQLKYNTGTIEKLEKEVEAIDREVKKFQVEFKQATADRKLVVAQKVSLMNKRQADKSENESIIEQLNYIVEAIKLGERPYISEKIKPKLAKHVLAVYNQVARRPSSYRQMEIQNSDASEILAVDNSGRNVKEVSREDEVLNLASMLRYRIGIDISYPGEAEKFAEVCMKKHPELYTLYKNKMMATQKSTKTLNVLNELLSSMKYNELSSIVKNIHKTKMLIKKQEKKQKLSTKELRKMEQMKHLVILACQEIFVHVMQAMKYTPFALIEHPNLEKLEVNVIHCHELNIFWNFVELITYLHNNLVERAIQVRRYIDFESDVTRFFEVEDVINEDETEQEEDRGVVIRDLMKTLQSYNYEGSGIKVRGYNVRVDISDEKIVHRIDDEDERCSTIFRAALKKNIKPLARTKKNTKR